MFIVRCDRCGADSPAVEVTTVSMPLEGPPKNPAETAWLYPTPKGWDRIRGKMLCENCVARIDFAVKEKP
jgi:hypothetical protein